MHGGFRFDRLILQHSLHAQTIHPFSKKEKAKQKERKRQRLREREREKEREKEIAYNRNVNSNNFNKQTKYMELYGNFLQRKYFLSL